MKVPGQSSADRVVLAAFAGYFAVLVGMEAASALDLIDRPGWWIDWTKEPPRRPRIGGVIR